MLFRSAIVAVIWHDLGKVSLVDEQNPSTLKIPTEAIIDHERENLFLLGKAVGQSQFSRQKENRSLRILASTIGNVHNFRIYQDHVALIRQIDAISAKFSSENKISNGGFNEVVAQ